MSKLALLLPTPLHCALCTLRPVVLPNGSAAGTTYVLRTTTTTTRTKCCCYVALPREEWQEDLTRTPPSPAGSVVPCGTEVSSGCHFQKQSNQPRRRMKKPPLLPTYRYQYSNSGNLPSRSWFMSYIAHQTHP